MRHFTRMFAAAACIALVASAHAADPKRMEWKVNDVDREALVYIPPAAKKAESPVVFAFHGHGGNMKYSADKFAIHKLWPEAIAVYMQGLKTPGRLTDPEGKLPGWQKSLGDQGDRDLKFFDAVFEGLKTDAKVDERRVFAMGHSNGGAFTYLLWAARGDRFEALAPCAAAATFGEGFKPKPVFHLAGREDKLVQFAWQERTIDALRKLDQCEEGKPWGSEKWCTFYPSKGGNPVVACIHPGGHELPPEAPPMIVRFFKEQARGKTPDR